MRTENDLRNAFDRLADEAPDAAELMNRLSGTTPPARRRRPGPLIAVTVAATVAAVVAAPLLLDRTPSSSPAVQAAQPADPFPFRFDDLPAGWSQNGGRLTADAVSRNIVGPKELLCEVKAYRGVISQPDRLTDRKPAAPVDDRPAVSGVLHMPGYPPLRALAWEYRAGSWAVAHCRHELFPAWTPKLMTREQLERTIRWAAEATDFEVPQKFLMPLKVGRLPGDLRATEANLRHDPLPGTSIRLRGSAGEIELMVNNVHPTKAPMKPGYVLVEVGGEPAWWYAAISMLVVRDGEIDYTLQPLSGQFQDPQGTLTAIAEQVEVADPDRPATWFPFVPR